MKYQSELIKEIVEARGHKQSSLHYESECAESWIEEAKGAYPKLCDYQSEWLNYISILDDTGGEYPEPPIGEFPYVVLSDVTEATVDNVVPYAYKSAALRGNTLLNNVDLSKATLTNNNKITEEGYIVAYAKGDWSNAFIGQRQMKANTKYLCAVFVYENTLNGGAFGYLSDYSNTSSFIIDPNTNYEFKAGEIGTKILTMTTKSTVKDNSFSFRAYVSQEAKSGYVKFRVVAIKYEDYMENWDIGYFKDFGSVEMPVLTTSNEDGTKTNILRVNEDVTLCGIGDVKDELDCLTGEVKERIGEMVLNGSENWRGPFSGGATVEGMYYYTYDDTRIKRNTTSNVLTTISYGGFASVPFNSVWKKSEEGISSSNSTGLGLRLATKIASAAELKSYLQQNPTTLKYQLATESIKTVDLNIQDQNGKTLSVIKPIEGTMVLSTSSDTIKPLFSGEIPVEAITQNLASFIDLGTDIDLETDNYLEMDNDLEMEE